MNNIELSTIYLPILDEVYKAESKTSVLDGDETTVKKGNNGEIKIAKLDMDALGDFDRKSGYTEGSTSFVWETVKYDKERSQSLKIDRLDNEEALMMPFAKLSSEFLRTKVVPETDAARIAKIASKAGTKKSETLAAASNVIAALRACTNKFDEDEVPTESRILFITPTLLGLIADQDTTKSKEVLARFSQIITVPQTRMYTAVDLNTGSDSYGYKKSVAVYAISTDTEVDSSKTYYTKSEDVYTVVTSPTGNPSTSSYYEKTLEEGHDINFLAVEKSAAVTAMDQFIKYFTPDQDQAGDNHVFKYRNNNLYGHVYENKTAGVYVSYKA